MKRQGQFAAFIFTLIASLSSGSAWAATSATHASGPNLVLLFGSMIGGLIWLMTRRRKGARR